MLECLLYLKTRKILHLQDLPITWGPTELTTSCANHKVGTWHRGTTLSLHSRANVPAGWSHHQHRHQGTLTSPLVLLFLHQHVISPTHPGLYVYPHAIPQPLWTLWFKVPEIKGIYIRMRTCVTRQKYMVMKAW